MRNGRWDQRSYYISVVSEYLTDIKPIERVSDPRLRNILFAETRVQLAWKARGSGTANTVTDSGWQSFFQYLQNAQNVLLRAAEQDVEDPTPFARLQPVAMGLQLDHQIARTWLNEAVRRDPTNQQAHFGHLFLLCKKWGGSHEEMYDFARSTIKNLPTGSTLYSIMYLAYVENYLYLSSFEKDAEGAKAFLNDKRVRDESIQIYQKSFQQRPRIEQPFEYMPHNVTTWWFYKLNMLDIVRQETKKIGPYFTRHPWTMFYKDPADVYQKVRNV